MGLHHHDEVVLLLGAPGAGKGTQARFLADLLGMPHVASGDLLREHRQRGTALGRTAQEYMDRGDLVPDALVIDIILDRLNQPDAAGGALLDGFPRTIGQAEALDKRLARRGGSVSMAIYVDVPTMSWLSDWLADGSAVPARPRTTRSSIRQGAPASATPAAPSCISARTTSAKSSLNG